MAAVALLHGYDPLRLLAAPPSELPLLLAILERATKLREDRERSLADYQANKTAGATAKGITQWLKTNLPRMFGS